MRGAEAQTNTRPQGGAKAWVRAERLAPLSGIAPIVLALTGLIVLEGPAENVFGALYAEQLSPQAAQTFYLFGDVFLYPAAMGAAVLVAATALAALRTGALPRWLAWSSLPLALWLLIPPLGPAAGSPENPAAWTGLAALPVVLLWTTVTAVGLMRKSRER
jgi:hypothetical protein